MDEGTNAHQAGFHGDVDDDLRQPVVAHDAGRLAQDEQFGVSRRIDGANRLIERARHDSIVDDRDSPNRHLSDRQRSSGFFDRLPHEVIVRHLASIRGVRIETLLLDAGGVLVFPNWHRISATLSRHGITVSADALRDADPAARRAIDDSYHVASTSDADRGSKYFNLIFSSAGVPRGAALDGALRELWDYHMEHNLWEYVPPDVVPALERLAGLGITLAIASNANGVLQRALERVGLHRYFRAICDSCVEGAEKPDPRFFEIVLERSGGRAETTVHVGDLYHVDVVGARRAGLKALLMDPHDLYRDFDVDRVRNLGDVVRFVTP